MLSSPFRRSTLRPAHAAAALGALAFAAACGNSTGPDDEPKIESVRLTVTQSGSTQGTTYVVTANGATPSPVQLRVGTSTLVAVPLDAAGRTIDEASEFELRMENLPGAVTFSRNGTLTANIIAASAVASPATVRAVMWHRTENHGDYTANFPLTVAP